MLISVLLSIKRCRTLTLTVADDTPGAKAFPKFLRQGSLHYLPEMLSPRLEERIRSFEVEVGTTSSVKYICLCVILNDIRASEKAEKSVNLWTCHILCVAERSAVVHG